MCRSSQRFTCKGDPAGSKIGKETYLSLSFKLAVWMTVELKKSCVRDSSCTRVKRNDFFRICVKPKASWFLWPLSGPSFGSPSADICLALASMCWGECVWLCCELALLACHICAQSASPLGPHQEAAGGLGLLLSREGHVGQRWCSWNSGLQSPSTHLLPFPRGNGT